MPKNLGLIFLIGLFLFLRIFNLEKEVNFSAEQGLFLNEAFEIYKTKKPTLIGPATSIKSKISQEFYQGPATYYLLIPPLVIFRGEVIAVSYWLIFLNSIALLIIYLSAQKQFDSKVAFWSAFFFATSPQLVTFSRFVWNPNFLPLFASILLFLMVKTNKNNKFFHFILLGFTLGLCLQFHYQAVLLILLTFIWLMIKKTSLTRLIYVFLGFIIGFSPLIIFELRHNFYNLKTLLLILQTGTDKTLSFLPFYYILCLVPFLAVFIGFFVKKLFSFNKTVGFLLIFFYLFLSTKEIYSFSYQAPGMPEGWNYLGEKEVVKIILKEDKKSYNIANLLTGNTRANATRYLLTIAGKPAGDVSSYPQVDWLFVISRYDEQRTKKDPVWEVSSFVPSRITKQWPIQNGINLYLFEKINKK